MEVEKKLKKPVYKRVWFILIVVIVVVGIVGSILPDNKSESVSATAPEITAQEEIQIEEIVAANNEKETVSQKNAVRAANSYLEFMAFSRQGLIGQLEFEGYSNADAVYGVDNTNADWNKQAVKSAEAYLNLMAFSRQGLIEQLKYEGYTSEQAVYGVDAVGL